MFAFSSFLQYYRIFLSILGEVVLLQVIETTLNSVLEMHKWGIWIGAVAIAKKFENLQKKYDNQ